MKSWWFVVLGFAVFMHIKEAFAQKGSSNHIKSKFRIENPVGIPNTVPFKFQPDNTKKKDIRVAYHYVGIDNEPSYPGGDDVFISSYLNKNIHVIPEIKGRVIVSFIVEKDGSLINFRIVRGVNEDTDNKVIRVLKQSPKWIPGRKNGKVVNVWYIMAININNK